MKKYFGIALLFLAAACQQAEKKSAEQNEKSGVSASNVTASEPKFEDAKVAAIYNDYISLKDALVSSKLDDSKIAADKLNSSLKAYNGCENTAIIADKIKTAKDLSAQRDAFTTLSNDVIALFKHAAIEKGTIYVQHCPMANNGNGGDWLAKEKKIANPYYGDEMLECGAVTEEIKGK